MPTLCVKGRSIECPLPYSEGHVCTAAEAAELNKLRTERVGALLRKAISEGVTDQSELERFARTYSFTRPPFEMPHDPIRQEALKIARSIVRERTENLAKDQIDLLIENASRSQEVLAEAARRVECAQAIAQSALDMSDIIA